VFVVEQVGVGLHRSLSWRGAGPWQSCVIKTLQSMPLLVQVLVGPFYMLLIDPWLDLKQLLCSLLDVLWLCLVVISFVSFLVWAQLWA